jgi:tape measure domain-containing protein
MTATVVVDIVGKDNFSSTLGNFGNIITGISSAINLAGDALRAFGDFAMEGIEAIASYERIGLSFESLIASQLLMSGSAKDMAGAYAVASIQAEQLLKWSQELAINSPFTQEGVALALRQAMAYGFNVTEAQRLTEALIDFASGSGASEETMRRIVLALGQMQQTGKLLGQDLNQLSQAGLPVIEILADHFGVTTQRIMEMREDGLIPAQEAIEAFTSYMETNFAGAAANQAISWAGLMSTFEDLKQMGLREFFGGLAEAIHPLAVGFSEWFQGPGLIFLSALGDILGKLATDTLDKLSGFAPVMETINESLLLFSGLIQIGLTPLEAFQKVLEKLSLAWDDTPLGNLIERIQEFIQTAETEGWGAAFGDLFNDIVTGLSSGFDVEGTIQGLVDKLVKAVGEADWSIIGERVGDAIGIGVRIALETLDTIVTDIDWKPLGDALFDAIKEVLEGMFSSSRMEEVDEIAESLGQTLIDAIEEKLKTAFAENWDTWIFGPILAPPENWKETIREWVDDNIIDPIKRALGIASPSTVFADIGRNIVLGLISGLGTMAGTLLMMVEGLVDIILAPLQPILDLLGIGGSTGSTGGIDTSGSGWSDRGGGTGTAGSGTGGTPAGGAVVNNFYAAVYFGDMGQLGYDCPSPHPLMTASSQSLLTSGLE